MTSNFEVVISGISGRFPGCDDVRTFQGKLYNSESFISENNRKWPHDYKYNVGREVVIPHYIGVYKDEEAYDPSVFKITNKFSSSFDVINRIVLEPSFEAIVDAGINPYTLSGRNIGVFAITGICETDSTQDLSKLNPTILMILGSSKTMEANRISFALNFTGPSFTFHSDPMGSLQALSTAYRLISTGFIEAAVVVVASHLVDPKFSVQYFALNLLSPDGLSRVFDKSANGFARSEATVALFLQRAEDAKRNYGSIIACDATYYGFRDTPFIGYEEDELKYFLEPIYTEKGNKKFVDELSFIELSACGDQRRDTIECNAITDVVGKYSKNPILVGSVISNIGNTDASVPYISLLKTILALSNEVIAPNIHFSEPNNRIKGFKNHNLQVIKNPTKLSGNKAALNSMGLSSNFGHIILQKNKRTIKQDDKITNKPSCRLLLICGRTEDGLRSAIEKIQSIPYNPEFISLTNDVFSSDMPFHVYRGYTVLPQRTKSQFDIQERGENTRPIWFIFSGMGSQWNGMGHELLEIPVFAEVVERSDKVLRPKGIDIYNILTSEDPSIFDNIVHSFVGILTIQIGLFEVLKTLKIYADGIIGHSAGENGCAYADNCLTLEQAILAAYERGKASTEIKTIKGMMAAIGKGYNAIKAELPDDIMIACHNSAESCTLSGPADKVSAYVSQLQKNGVFAKAVNVSNIAYHSKYIAAAGPYLINSLKKVILNPQKRSSKWISTSVPESDWHSNLSQFCSAEYLTNNLLNPVLFEEGCKHIPSNAVLIEIAPHGLLQAILKRSLPSTCTHIPLTLRSKQKENLSFLFSAIGKLYIEGYHPDINELFPKISYPVHGSTPSISPFCTWLEVKYESDKMLFRKIRDPSKLDEEIPIFMNDDAEYNFLKYHKIEGQEVIPTAFLMYLVWNFFSENDKTLKSPIVFEDVMIHKNLKISTAKDPQHVTLLAISENVSQMFINYLEPRYVTISIQKTGDFEMLLQKKYKDKSVIIISGNIKLLEEDVKHYDSRKSMKNLDVQLNQQQIYEIFKKNGYHMENCFASINHISYNNTECFGRIKWTGNWVLFLDAVIKFQMFTDMKETSNILYPFFIKYLSICSSELTTVSKGTDIIYFKNLITGITTGMGMTLKSIEYCSQSSKEKLPEVKAYKFVSYTNPECESQKQFIELCLHLVAENALINLKTKNGELCIIEKTKTYFRIIQSILERNRNFKVKTKIYPVSSTNPKLLHSENTCFLLVTSCPYEIFELTDTEYSFILVIDATIKFPDEFQKLYTSIMKQKFSNQTYWLFKRKITMNLPILEASQCENMINLQHQPNIILQKNINSFNLPIITSKRKKGDKNRYLFLLDNSPDSQTIESLVQSQISKDLSVSILRNGEWGFYKSTPYEYMNSTSDDISLVDTNLKSVDVRFLRLHPERTDNQRTYKKNCYGIEYAGVHISGTRVVGVAIINTNNSKSDSEEDSILKWRIPDDWSLEEATTVPLVYIQAYYITQFFGRRMHESILINVGDDIYLPLACISVCLSRGLSVFVFVSNINQETLIRKMFPMLENIRVLHQVNDAYKDEIIKLTQGHKMDFVVNCMSGVNHYMDVFVSCMSYLSCYIEVGKKNCSYLNQLGLSMFLQAETFRILPNDISIFMELPENMKIRLKTDVEDGIKQGVVTPFSNTRLLNSHMDYDLCDTKVKMVNQHSSENKMKVPHNQKLRLDGHHSYIIIGQRKKSEWLQVTEWLLSKGALYLTVVLDNFVLGSKVSSQLNQLLNHTKCKISFVPSLNVDGINGATRIIADAHKIAPVEAIFFVSLDQFESTMYNMDIASRKINPNILFVSVFSGGLYECEMRRCDNLPAVMIHSGKFETNKTSILSEAFRILTTMNYSDLPTFLEISDQEVISKSIKPLVALKDFLPQNIDILETIGICTTDKSKFLEIGTLAPRYFDTHGVYPVFVIPATHKERLQPIFKKIAYPAFCATLGYSANTLMDIVEDLYTSLNKIQPTGPVTLVSEAWSAILTVQLSLLLENKGRQYRLFFLKADYVQWRHCIQDLGPIKSPEFEANLIQQIFNFDSEINTRITKSTRNLPFSDQVERYLSTINLRQDKIRYITKAAMMIRKLIIMVSEYNNEHVIVKWATLFERFISKEFSEKLSMSSNIEIINEDSYDNFVSHPSITETLNKNAIFSWWDYTKKCTSLPI